MNRIAGQTNRVNREAVLVRFVCSALRFIPHEPRKKDTHSLYLQCFQQGPFLQFSDKRYKFKIPTATCFNIISCINHCACDSAQLQELLHDSNYREMNRKILAGFNEGNTIPL